MQRNRLAAWYILDRDGKLQAIAPAETDAGKEGQFIDALSTFMETIEA